jgi:hypothetical protein
MIAYFGGQLLHTGNERKFFVLTFYYVGGYNKNA